MEKVTFGLISSPGLPAKLTSKLVDDLPAFLSNHVDQSVLWESEILIDPLVGTAEAMNQLMNKAVHLKNKNDWDCVICLTDLPHFMEKHIIRADINITNRVGLISIPAFGSFPMRHRIKKMISKILNDMRHTDELNTSQISRQKYKENRKKQKFSFVKRMNLYKIHEKTKDAQHEEQITNIMDNGTKSNHKCNNEKENKDEETQEDTESKSDIRYLLKSKLFGHICILTGMTFANRPWTALNSFKKVLMFAFGTGVYITLFPTSWELSTIYTIPRFILLMFAAICGMVTWIIFAHKLWEKPTLEGDIRLRNLYNQTTITTLFIIVLINYIVLYCFFLMTIGIFVPPGLFEAGTDLNDDPTIKYYLRFTWLITSLGTLAGSIGTVGENEAKIQQVTYSYRQMNRYYEIQDKNKDDKK